MNNEQKIQKHLDRAGRWYRLRSRYIKKAHMQKAPTWPFMALLLVFIAVTSLLNMTLIAGSVGVFIALVATVPIFCDWRESQNLSKISRIPRPTPKNTKEDPIWIAGMYGYGAYERALAAQAQETA